MEIETLTFQVPEFLAVECPSCRINQVLPLTESFRCRVCCQKHFILESVIFGRSSKAKEMRALVQGANMQLSQCVCVKQEQVNDQVFIKEE